MVKKLKKLVVVSVVLSVLISNISIAASGSAVVYYQNNIGHGHVNRVCTLLKEMGYSVGNTVVTKQTFLNSLNSKKIVHNISHGTDTGGLCLSDATLYPSDITDSCSSLKFVLLESCWSSAPARQIYILGASCAVGFDQTVTAGTDNDGIHLYSSYLFGYAKTNNIKDSAAYAMSTLYNTSGYYYGSNSSVVYGGNTTIY